MPRTVNHRTEEDTLAGSCGGSRDADRISVPESSGTKV